MGVEPMSLKSLNHRKSELGRILDSFFIWKSPLEAGNILTCINWYWLQFKCLGILNGIARACRRNHDSTYLSNNLKHVPWVGPQINNIFFSNADIFLPPPHHVRKLKFSLISSCWFVLHVMTVLSNFGPKYWSYKIAQSVLFPLLICFACNDNFIKFWTKIMVLEK